MQKKLLYGQEARQKVKDGIDKVVNMVKVTLGAAGRTVIMKRSYIHPQLGLQQLRSTVSKDGITVLRSITLDDSLENIGADFAKEAAEKTVEMAGDGTTTTCVLLQALVSEGLKLIDAGANPGNIKNGMEKGVADVVAKLKEQAIPVGDDIETIRNIATVSANNDSSIGNLIADAYKKIGKDGIIDIEESHSTKTEIKVSDGVKFNQGWINRYFVNNPAKGECELVNPFIFLYDKKLTHIKPLEAVLNIVIQNQRPLLIICDDADGEAEAALGMNAQKAIMEGKGLQCCIVKSPEYGVEKHDAMEDLAISVGGVYMSQEKGIGIDKIKIDQLGQADKVVITKTDTTIISGKGDVKGLIADLQIQLSDKEGIEREPLEKRIAKLTGGVAVLYVGGSTEVEMKERKDRCDDAVRATRAAIVEGVIAGGGAGFIRAYKRDIGLSPGQRLINDVLSSPILQICTNAGVNDPKKIVDMLMCDDQPNLGYNVNTDDIEDLVAAGIIDPVKCLRVSLENAVSAAGMILTSEGLICDTF
jgi:chaperonin GroEL